MTDEDLVTSYDSQGYVKLDGFLTREEVASVTDELRCFLNDPTLLPVRPPPFHSLSSREALKSLRESTNGVYLFGPSSAQIDTVGHGVHLVENSTIRAVSTSLRVEKLCLTLGRMKEPRLVQSKFVMKPAKWGALVPAHADEQYIFTEPSSGLALWIPLEASDETNGTIQVLPRSHLEFDKGPRFWCDEELGLARWRSQSSGCGGGSVPTEKKRFPFSKQEQSILPWIPVSCNPGDCVVIHPALLHMSLPNRSSNKSRRVFTLHFVDGSSEFLGGNWLVPKSLR